MKGCAVFVGLMIAILGAGYGFFVIDRSQEKYEARFVGALRYVEQTIEDALIGTGDVQFFAPSMEPEAQPDTWRVTGVVALTAAVAGAEHQRYSATLTKLCDAYADPACWHLDSLTIGGRPLVDVVTERRKPMRAPVAASPTPTPAPAATPAAAPAAEALGRQDKPAAAKAPAPPASAAADREAESADASLVKEIQRGLKRAGFDPGPVDGIMGSATRAAIEAYQRRNNLPVDGTPSRELLRRLGTGR